MTALRVAVLWLAEGTGGSANGPWSTSGESMIIGPLADSFAVTEPRLGEDSSGVLGLLVDTFLTLPTRTTMARAGVAVWALALFRNVDPTLKVLPAGLGGLRTPPLYFS